jgi:hypothetical protein
MTKTHTLNKDGSLTIVTDNGDGTGSQTDIEAAQIAAFRRDPDFDAALPDDIRAKLDAPPAE